MRLKCFNQITVLKYYAFFLTTYKEITKEHTKPFKKTILTTNFQNLYCYARFQYGNTVKKQTKPHNINSKISNLPRLNQELSFLGTQNFPTGYLHLNMHFLCACWLFVVWIFILLRLAVVKGLHFFPSFLPIFQTAMTRTKRMRTHVYTHICYYILILWSLKIAFVVALAVEKDLDTYTTLLPSCSFATIYSNRWN